ncbi:MAG: carboxymuconolactone decarboxylase family protein [Acidimicrobiales bacterium]
MPDQAPTAEQIRAQMQNQLGTVPAAIDKSLGADPTLIFEHVRAQQYAMPPENGALDPQERTLVYLAVALATSNHACTEAMVGKARVQGIATQKLLEAFHIARFAQATAVLGNAEPLFDLINERNAGADGQ